MAYDKLNELECSEVYDIWDTANLSDGIIGDYTPYCVRMHLFKSF